MAYITNNNDDTVISGSHVSSNGKNVVIYGKLDDVSGGAQISSSGRNVKIYGTSD